MVGSSSDII